MRKTPLESAIGRVRIAMSNPRTPGVEGWRSLRVDLEYVLRRIDSMMESAEAGRQVIARARDIADEAKAGKLDP